MATRKAFIKQLKGITLTGKTDSSHWITMDGPETFGGSGAGVRPKELVLLALGGCTCSDVISILNKKKVKMDSFEMNITAELAETHPQVFTDINLEYLFYGDDIQEKDVERAIDLSINTYCAVTAMLIKSVNITHSYKIIKSQK
ncbi:MAG: OsmC family protein [Ignavibacteriales bacterium]|nr:MAG: OsmC family protein [Ignavibacteriales bacterium]